MMEQDKERFAEGMRLLFATFGMEFNEERAYGYWVGLTNKLTIEAFMHAVTLALEECERMPSPVQLKHFGQRALQSAYRQLPPMSDTEKKRIRESWPEKGKE